MLWSWLPAYIEANSQYQRSKAILRLERARWIRLRRRGLSSKQADVIVGETLAMKRAHKARVIFNRIRFGAFGGLSLVEAVWTAPDDL